MNLNWNWKTKKYLLIKFQFWLIFKEKQIEPLNDKKFFKIGLKMTGFYFPNLIFSIFSFKIEKTLVFLFVVVFN